VLARTLTATLAALALVPAAASGSVAYHDRNGNPAAEGGPGDDTIAARTSDEGVVFTDPAGITVRDPELGQCRQDTETQVTCSGQGAVLLGGAGVDTLRDEGLTAGFGARGGPGDDTIVAGSVAALIFGDDDRVRPDDGNDTITGSSAEVIPGQGPEDDFADQIAGGGGNDQIDGGAGRDVVSGQAGNDTVMGGDGNDDLDTLSLLTEDEQDAPGDAGDDTLSGGAGNDDIDAYRGKDTVDAGDGDDRMRSRDLFLFEDDEAADTFRCGAGSDRVSAGGKDRLAIDCETLVGILSCWRGYPCRVSAKVTGRPKGAKKTRTVSKASKTVDSAANLDIAFGSKAAKALGGSSKLSLDVTIEGYRGKLFSNALRFRIQAIR
jgi:Ca2+-binding RTX toxin-like protein